MFSKTIYKTDSKGKIRFLTINAYKDELIQISGTENTENPVEHRSKCTGKNIGRSNETTPEEQALLEAQAKYTEKIKEGYSDTIAEARNNKIILPMLAKSYKDESHKIDWSKAVYVQPKLDGMRALGCANTPMISRKNTVIDTVNHIQQELNSLPIGDIFDGELYCHGKNFQENMRLIKKYRPGETEAVKYRVYDLVLGNLPFEERYDLLKHFVAGLSSIEIVPTYRIHSEAELKEYHKQFLAEGYEGTIIRHSDAGYAINHRDTQLLKYKDFLDITCEIVDVLPSEKNPLQGIVQCKMSEQNSITPGVTFGCGMKFSHAEREEILKNKDKYIGQMAEVRFFEYSEDGVPRFPVCHGFRLDC